ncbi:MAG: hypothetical protein BWZ10_03087 [candidate division BRC1 bacterium ADurb.BinA364]|nr:MAG: hypothetical protein BWZ10_03087 [candidate division BRC1 bacterium ADurb.BinA364]
MSHLRHMPLFAIAAAPMAAQCWAEAARERFGRRPRAGKWIAAAVCGLALGLSVYLAGRGGPFSPAARAAQLLRGRAYSIDDYPVRLCDFIEDARLPGRMWNDSRYAGYLIWRFSPETHRVFTDMRYDIFGARFLAEDYAVRLGAVEIRQGQAAQYGYLPRAENPDAAFELTWRHVFEKWGVDFAILDYLEGRDPNGRFYPWSTIPALDASSEWALVYRDPLERGLRIYLRLAPHTAEAFRRCRELAPYALYQRPGRAPFGE